MKYMQINALKINEITIISNEVFEHESCAGYEKVCTEDVALRITKKDLNEHFIRVDNLDESQLNYIKDLKEHNKKLAESCILGLRGGSND